MRGGKDLMASERGWFCVVVAIAASALLYFGKISGEQWLSFMWKLAAALLFVKTAEKFSPQVAETLPGAIAFETQSKTTIETKGESQ